MPISDDLLTTAAAAEVLGVSAETLRRWADTKRIRHYRMPSGQLRFHADDLVLIPVEPTEDVAS